MDQTEAERSSDGARITMQDVARRAGVSTMTVSRALAAPDKVAEATRERVRTAIRDLGYVPDLVAGSLSSGRSRIVAALVSTLANSVFAETVDGLTAGLRAHGYQLLLGSTDYSAEAEEALVRAVLGRRPDGLVIAAGEHTAATRLALERARIPIVETWDLPDRPLGLAVGFSNVDAGRAMTEALAGWGYRAIAFAGGDPADSLRGRLRRDGYLAALRRLGRTPIEIAAGPGRKAMAAGAAAVRTLCDRDARADALFCVSDPVAAGAMMECRRRSIAVPDELAIVGFGDFDIAGGDALELTTVRVPKYEIGARSAAILIEALAGQPVGAPVVDLGFEIVRRRSA
ncbi:MAG TPA: LacI family DNA-binding transcriptional regulator [Geminicoccaceae bacterium]